MADVATAVRQYLVGKSAVSAIVSSRIYPDTLPQGATLPAVTYTKISTVHEHVLSTLAGLAASRIEFSCFANNRADANNLASVIQQCGIIAHKGTTNSVDIRAVQLEDGQQTYQEPPTDGSQVHRYVTTFDLMVSYQEGLGT
jgi:hypothetical protein